MIIFDARHIRGFGVICLKPDLYLYKRITQFDLIYNFFLYSLSCTKEANTK